MSVMARRLTAERPGTDGWGMRLAVLAMAGYDRSAESNRVGWLPTACYHTAPFGPSNGPKCLYPCHLEDSMARVCSICGKTSMGTFNPQSSGMNRVRAHRRAQPNLQPLTIVTNGVATKVVACVRCRRTQTKNAK